MQMPAITDHRSAIAAHRFGLGEARLDAIGSDPAGWLLQQVGAADSALGHQLVDAAEGVRIQLAFVQQQQALRRRDAQAPMQGGTMAEPMQPSMAPPSNRTAEQMFADHYREVSQNDLRAHLATPAASKRPFAERLVLFWANHFTVSIAKPTVRSLAGAFEREAIRPHIASRFSTLLRASVKHAAMLRYLDNDQSAGPHSPVVQRRARGVNAQAGIGPRVAGLNENLAREVLELHTLGAQAAREGVYTQADVTALARVLTGWRVPALAALPDSDPGAVRFDIQWHEPGPKTVVGHAVASGAEGLDAILEPLAMHPATMRFVCTKLARHLVADAPDAGMVDAMVRAWSKSGGELPAVYRALVEHPAAWMPEPVKLKSPVEYALSTARVLGLGASMFERNPDAGLSMMGQRPLLAPSPAGWPDRAEEWLGPDAVWKRIEWTSRLAERVSRNVDARSAAVASLGPRLGRDTALQIERAADGAQALALWLLSPEFQRR